MTPDHITSTNIPYEPDTYYRLTWDPKRQVTIVEWFDINGDYSGVTIDRDTPDEIRKRIGTFLEVPE